MDVAASHVPKRPTRYYIERGLAQIWREALGVQKVTREDDFFAFGCDSAAAAKLLTAIEEGFKVTVPLSTLVENPTIGQLAGWIETAVAEDGPEMLIPVRSTGTRPPLFLVHGLMGHAIFAHVLAKFLGEDQPLYGIRARGFDGQKAPMDSVSAMATEYLSLIRSVQPRGPYFICGNCSGSFVALEMCRTLLSDGETIGMMLAIDPLEPGVSFTQRELGRQYRPGDECSDVFRARLRQRLENKIYGRGALNEERLQWPIDVAAALDIAISRHNPPPYPGPVTIIASADRVQDIFDPNLAWRKLAGKGTRVHAVSARHRSLFLDKGPLIAQLIRKTMDEALAVA